MSAECAIVANDTSPVKEAIKDQETGSLTNFFDHAQLVKSVSKEHDVQEQGAYFEQNAHAFAKVGYYLNSFYIPDHLAWVDELAKAPLEIFVKTNVGRK